MGMLAVFRQSQRQLARFMILGFLFSYMGMSWAGTNMVGVDMVLNDSVTQVVAHHCHSTDKTMSSHQDCAKSCCQTDVGCLSLCQCSMTTSGVLGVAFVGVASIQLLHVTQTIFLEQAPDSIVTAQLIKPPIRFH